MDLAFTATLIEQMRSQNIQQFQVESSPDGAMSLTVFLHPESLPCVMDQERPTVESELGGDWSPHLPPTKKGHLVQDGGEPLDEMTDLFGKADDPDASA